jgi:hypothetical protein
MAQMGHTSKKLGQKAFSSILNFQQMFIQGLWEKTDPLQQLPGMTTEIVKKYRKMLKQHQIENPSIETFCRLSPE